MIKMTLKNYVIDAMIDELNEMEGRTGYGCDLGYAIFEYANLDGTYTYSTKKSIEWIGKYFSEIGDIVDDIKANTGENILPNPFNNPEAFQVVIMLEMSNAFCAQCPFIDENLNNEIELTEENIKLIISQLEELKY